MAIKDLINEVYSCLSQPAATEIGHFLLVKQKSKAKKLLKKEEGHWITDEQVDQFIEHEYKRLTSRSMSVKEITKEEVIQTPRDNYEKAQRYLVRVGTMVFVSKCLMGRFEKCGVFTAPNHYEYDLKQVDQVFQIDLV